MEREAVVVDELAFDQELSPEVAFDDEAGLLQAVRRLLDDGDERGRLARAARKVSLENADALDRIAAALAPFFDDLPEGG